MPPRIWEANKEISKEERMFVCMWIKNKRGNLQKFGQIASSYCGVNMIKSLVYQPLPRIMWALKMKIRTVFNAIPHEEVARSVKSMKERGSQLVAARGRQFEGTRREEYRQYRVAQKKCPLGFRTITPERKGLGWKIRPVWKIWENPHLMDAVILHFGYLGAEKIEFKVGRSNFKMFGQIF